MLNSSNNNQALNRAQQQQNNSNIPKPSMQNIGNAQQNRLLINNESYGLNNNIRKHSAGSVEILNEKLSSNERLHSNIQSNQQKGAHLNRLQHNTWKSKSTTRINQMTTGGNQVRRSSSNRAMPSTPIGATALSAANSNSNLNQSANSGKLAVMNRTPTNNLADQSITQFAIIDDCSNYAGAGNLAGRSNADRLGGQTLYSKWCASFEDDQDDADNSANDLVQVDDLAAASSGNIAQSNEDYQSELSKKLKQTSLNEPKYETNSEDGASPISNPKCLTKPNADEQANNDQLKEPNNGMKCIVNSNSSQKIRLQIIPSSNQISAEIDESKQNYDNDKKVEEQNKEEVEDEEEEEDEESEEEEVELVILEKKIIKNGKVIQVTEEIIEEKSIPKANSNRNQADKKINRNQVQDKSKDRLKFFEFLDEPDGRVTNIVVKTVSPPVLTTAKPVIVNKQQQPLYHHQISSPAIKTNKETDNIKPMQLQVTKQQPSSIEKIDTKKNSVYESKSPNVIRRRDAKRNSPMSLRSYSDPEHYENLTGIKQSHSGFLYVNDEIIEQLDEHRNSSINQPQHRQKSNVKTRSNQLILKSILPIKQQAFENKIKRLNLPRSWSSPLISTYIRNSITPPLRQRLSFQNFNEDIVFNLDITRNIAIVCSKSDNRLNTPSNLRKNSVFCFNGLSSSLPNIHLCLEEDRIPLSEPCAYYKQSNNLKEESPSSASHSSEQNLFNQYKRLNRTQSNKSDSTKEANYEIKSDTRYEKKNKSNDSDKCDDNEIPSKLNKNYFKSNRAENEEDEEELIDQNPIYNYINSSMTSKKIPSPPELNSLFKSFGSTGKVNRLGSTGSTAVYNSALNRSPYSNQVTRSSTTSNISNYSSNAQALASTNLGSNKLSSGFNGSLTGLSSLTANSNALNKFNADIPYRRKKPNLFNSNSNSPLSSINYTFNNHLNSGNYNGSYTNLYNATNTNTGSTLIGNTTNKYLPSSDFFIRQSISSPSSSSANLSSGNYLSNYLTNSSTSSPLSHHSNNNYLAFKSSTNTSYRPLQATYSTTGTSGFTSTNLPFSNRILTGLSTQPTDTEQSLIR